ncbi:GNAT family N-acetyltransferase [Neisseria sp. Ec49-e6-T10]|uniref:GNAT family N-acetyltransferase n=1 Tax=Neisseria sp. Ec49-e6-T10 TaxID=3140744 RepID=UPI003EB8F745
MIRFAQQKDLPAIVSIYNQSVPKRNATADLSPISVESRQSWFEHHTANRPLYVWVNEQNHILAWASLSDYYPRAAYHITAEISIYVDEQQQGKGLGKALAKHILKEAPNLGIHNIIAVIFGHNTASITLFEQLGFSLWGKLPEVCELDNKFADIILLGKKCL